MLITLLLALFLTIIVLSLVTLIRSLYSPKHYVYEETAPAGCMPPEEPIVVDSDLGNSDQVQASPNSDEGEKKKKRRRRRVKKKQPEEEASVDSEKKTSSFPFTAMASNMQQRISENYERVLKLHASDSLTAVQVMEFVNCLVDARRGLNIRSEQIYRKVSIANTLLNKAGRPTVNRLSEMIERLGHEYFRYKEDASAYNGFLTLLKSSPTFAKIEELRATIEMAETLERQEAAREAFSDDIEDFGEISFEELLEKEKKAVFWQKHKIVRQI